VHAEDAVRGDQTQPGLLRFLEPPFQLGHVIVSVTEAVGLAQAHSVDDAGVIQLVRQDRVFFSKDRLEEPTVGVPARRVKDRVVLAEEAGNGSFKSLVQILGATDESHGGQTIPVMVETFVSSGDESGVIGEAKIVVGAEVNDLAAPDLDGRPLRSLKLALA